MRYKKKLKLIVIAAIVLLILSVSIIVGSSYLNHQYLMDKEKENYPAPGNLVDVNNDGNKVHVYAQGEGNKTLVFMSGLGTSSPLYDFKVLYKNLAQDNRIIVVERAGYGWSDITSTPRDIDTILEETRKSLILSEEEPPYILVPHSIAGLEALYWATLYPEEVETIIGLDPLVPGYYQQTKEKPSFSYIITILARTGLMREQPDVFSENFPAMKKGHLTEYDAKVARTIFYRRVHTENMREEGAMLPVNSHIVKEQGIPEIPFHAFISSENENIYWEKTITSYVNATGGEYFILDAGHYIHLDEPDILPEKVRTLIKT